jgi:hypothetical protein
MEVQHTPHFIQVSGVVWLRVALCGLFGRWTLSFLWLGGLSLNKLIFPPATLSLLPVFTKGDPLAVDATETTNLDGILLSPCTSKIFHRESTDLPPFDTSKRLLCGILSSQRRDNVFGSLLTTNKRNEYTRGVNPIRRRSTNIRELLEFFDSMSTVRKNTSATAWVYTDSR